MFNTYYKILNNKQLITFLLAGYVLTFLFGSSIFPISLRYFTLYPNLIFILLIFGISIFNFKIITNKVEKYSIGFFSVWSIYSFISIFLVEGKADAIIDFRSIILFSLTAYNLIWLKNYFGVDEFIKKLNPLIFSIYLFLIVIGLVEYFSGYHFEGNYSQYILERPEQSIKASFFLFDNVNNLTTYIIGLGLILMTLNIKENNLFITSTVLSSSLIYSYLLDSKIGIISCFIIGLVLIVKLLSKNFYFNIKAPLKSLYYLVLITLFGVCVLFNPIINNSNQRISFNGVKASTDILVIEKTAFTSKKIIEDKIPDGLVLIKDTANYYAHTLKFHYGSLNFRKAIFLNAWELFKEKPLLGIGPGQFRYSQKIGKQKYYSGTIQNPHFWLMEILAQYGIIILLGYIIILILSAFKKHLSWTLRVNSILILGAFLFASIMPSAFLILDINWMFTGIFIATLNNLNVQL